MSGLGRGLGSWKHIQFQTKIGLKITASVDFKWPPLRCSINVNGEHYFINRKIATEHKKKKSQPKYKITSITQQNVLALAQK